jgi:hypothetical protein
MTPALPHPEHDDAAGDLPTRLSRLLDGQLSAQEMEQLEAQLLQDPESLVEYCDCIDSEFMLAWELKRRVEGNVRVLVPTASHRAPPMRIVATWLIPLMLIGGGCLGLWMIGTGAKHSPGACTATLSREYAAVWKSPLAIAAGSELPTGPLALFEGTAQLTFASGAIVAVQGPAEFETLGHNRLLLRKGRITPFVPEAARGFTVVTPTGEVVDLGTEFSMSVAVDGKTDVFVIDGEVDVGQGQLATAAPMRLSQGFASTVAAGAAAPAMTQRPIFVERFDTPTPLFRRVGSEGNGEPLIGGGQLRIPIDGRSGIKDPTVQVLVDFDFSALVGRRSTIAYKVSLPSGVGLTPNRWAGLGIDAGEGPLPWAHKPGAAAGVLVSPKWQVGFYADGVAAEQRSIWPRQPIFPNGSEAVGPYQVVITIDDTPNVREHLGGASFGFMVNGVEFTREYPIQLGSRPRLFFQTWLHRWFTGFGYAVIDDFSVSIDSLPEKEPE